MPTNTRDPRSIITSETLGFDRQLLGMPLATPSRRLVALLIDLAVIGLLTVFTSGLTVFIWGFVALFLLRMAWRGPSQQMGQVTSALYRGSTGCLGLIVLVVVIAIGTTRLVTSNADLREGAGDVVSGLLEDGGFVQMEAYDALAEAGTRAEARDAARDLVRTMRDSGMDDDEITGLFGLLGPKGSEAVGDPGALARDVLASLDEESAPEETGSDVPEGVASLSLAEAAARYESGLEAGRSPDDDKEMAALLAALRGQVAGDELAALSQDLAEEEARRTRAEALLDEAETRAESGGGGFTALLRDIWDQAGSAVGLWSVYFTLTLTLFRGYTVGKRVMGIRVIRLDGQPINWWAALERAGGYVAGLATGFLGFLQIFWDPNRQCVHDKIGGTVVVMAGASADAAAAAAAWERSTPGAADAPSTPRRPAGAPQRRPPGPGDSSLPGPGSGA